MTDRFVSYDMPGNFIEDLERAIRDFELAIRETHASKGTAIAASASIDEAMEAGLNAIRRLDAIVPNRLRNDGAISAMWDLARRVEYPSARTKADAPPTHGAPAPQTT